MCPPPTNNLSIMGDIRKSFEDPMQPRLNQISNEVCLCLIITGNSESKQFKNEKMCKIGKVIRFNFGTRQITNCQVKNK